MRSLAVSLLVLALAASVVVPADASAEDPVLAHAESLAWLDAAVAGATQRLDLALDRRAEALSTGIPGHITRSFAVVGVTFSDLELDAASIGLIASVDPELAGALERPSSARERLVIISVSQMAVEERLVESLTQRPVRSVMLDDVEQWRLLVQMYFDRSDVQDALSVLECESGGDAEAKNRRSSARGLFQFLRGTWKYASTGAGFGGADPYDPEANIASAAWLVAQSRDSGQSAWHHWSCKP